MKEQDLRMLSEQEDFEREELVNIEGVQPDLSLPEAERMRGYMEKIKNPYHFRCGKLVVNLRFAANGESLKDRLTEYLTHMKNG